MKKYKKLILGTIIAVVIVIFFSTLYYSGFGRCKLGQLMYTKDRTNYYCYDIFKVDSEEDEEEIIDLENDDDDDDNSVDEAQIYREESDNTIYNLEDCPSTYADSQLEDYLEGNDYYFVSQQFPNEYEDTRSGTCIYTLEDGLYSRVFAHPTHRGINLIAYTNDRYLWGGTGCGTECYSIFRIDLDTGESTNPTFGPYYDLSPDNKYIISCRRQIDVSSEESEDNIKSIRNYMCHAVNISSMEKFYFAGNPILQDFLENKTTLNRNEISNYSLDFDTYQGYTDRGIFRYDEEVLYIAFTNTEGEVFERSFDMDDNFHELVDN